jgi:hypothetical protein
MRRSTSREMSLMAGEMLEKYVTDDGMIYGKGWIVTGGAGQSPLKMNVNSA